MIYVDEIRDYGTKGKWAHMWSSTGNLDELHAFAHRLGLRREWLHESRGISGDFKHYDLRPSKRELALRYGASYMPLKDWIMANKPA